MPSRRERMETLLRIRQREEDIQSQKLAAVRRDIGAAEQQRDSIGEMQRAMFTEAGESKAGSIDAPRIDNFYAFEAYLSRLSVETDANIAELRGRERDRLVELERAAIKKRTAERLSERAEADWQDLVSTEEKRAADEAAVVRDAFRRKHRR